MNKASIPIVAILAAAISYLVFHLLALAPIMPKAAAMEAVYVDQAYAAMLALTVPIFGVVVAAVLYSVVSFRAKDEREQGARFHHSRGHLVETVWISLSLVLTLGLAAYGAREFRLIRGDDRADLDVQVNAEQFSWEFYYPAYDQYGSALVLPRGKRARLLLASKDVVHSFWVPEFRLKQDAVPGKVVKLMLTPTVAGTYRLQCAELCGTDHTLMTSVVKVVEPEEFEASMRSEAW